MSQGMWPFFGDARLEITKAQGVHLFTSDGRKIIDAAGGAVVANIGHGRERVAQAVYRATKDVTYVVPPWLTPGRSDMVATLHRHWLPGELTHVHVTSGGSEAVESAVKLALQYHHALGNPERNQIITRSVSYHGTTLATANLSGHPLRKRGLTQALEENPKIPTTYPLRAPRGSNADLCQHYVDEFTAQIETLGANRIAALLAEPITGSSGGAIVPPDGYWQAIKKLCDQHGILLIFDEVMTGFGRTGKNFGHEHWSTVPDIMVSGKGLAGGYAPLGGVFANATIAQAIAAAELPVMFHTFGAHPAACAAANEVLNILVEENLVPRAAQMGERLHALLRDTFADHPHVAEVRGKGLLQAIEVVQDREHLAPYPDHLGVSRDIVAEGLKRDVFFYGGGTGEVRDIVCMGPPFIVEQEHLETMASVLRDAVDAATQRANALL